jgi:microcystin degradation protein MlrC
VVLADHSDRSGYATWLLREIIAQGLTRTLVATVADAKAIEALVASGAQPGDPFDREVGGLADESAGTPVRITGRLRALTTGGTSRAMGGGQLWAVVEFGASNVLVVSPFLAQVIEPEELWSLGLRAEEFDVIALKSRVHFRRGFDDSGFAPTILLVEPDEPFLGTVRLDGLRYETLRLSDYYPYGDPPGPVG